MNQPSKPKPKRFGRSDPLTFLTVAEVAELLSISPGSVRNHIHRGRLAAIDLNQDSGKRRRYRISEEGLADFVRRMRLPTATSRKRRRKRWERPVKQYV